MIILIPLLRKLNPALRMRVGSALLVVGILLAAVALLTSVHPFVSAAVALIIGVMMLGTALRDRRRGVAPMPDPR